MKSADEILADVLDELEDLEHRLQTARATVRPRMFCTRVIEALAEIREDAEGALARREVLAPLLERRQPAAATRGGAA